MVSENEDNDGDNMTVMMMMTTMISRQTILVGVEG